MTGILVGLLCAATWACSTVLQKELAKKLDPFTLNAPRTLIGGLSMMVLALATGRTGGYAQVTPNHLLFLLGSVYIGGGLGDSCYVWSLQRIGVSRAFPISSTYPALTFLLALLFLREALSVYVGLGLLLVTGGIVLISLPAAQRAGIPRNAAHGSGVIYALVAALAWGVSMTLVAPGMRGLDPIVVASFRTPALSLLLWGIVALRGTLPLLRTLTRREWVLLVAGGLLGWGLGSILFLWAVALLGAARAAIITAASPLFALPLSVIFLKEKVTPPVLVGTALAVVGIALVSQ
jgi:drug/metabolite transporter (DMT)-like permease